MTDGMLSDAENWTPPSKLLEKRDGIWHARASSTVSYPKEGNDVCFQVEDSSYWFAHRNECIRAIMGHFPSRGTFYGSSLR